MPPPTHGLEGTQRGSRWSGKERDWLSRGGYRFGSLGPVQGWLPRVSAAHCRAAQAFLTKELTTHVLSFKPCVLKFAVSQFQVQKTGNKVQQSVTVLDSWAAGLARSLCGPPGRTGQSLSTHKPMGLVGGWALPL